MSEKRRGLGRGIGALIPPAPSQSDAAAVPGRDRPVDVFFPNGPGGRSGTVSRGTAAADGASADAVGEAVDVPRETPGHPAPADDVAGLPGSAGTTHDAGGTAQGNPASTPVEPVDSPGRHTGPENDAAPSRTDEDVDGLLPVPGARFAELPVAAIRPNSRQPRQVFDQDAMDELVHSVREIGVLQPVVVRPLAEPDGDGARFELIMGERRWRASAAAGLDVVPAIVRATDDDVMLRDALLENLHRSELNPLEEAAAYQQLLEDFGCTQDELSRRIGRSRPQISNTIRLLRLPPAVQRRVAAGVLSAGHARALLALDDSTAAERLAHRIVSEGLSVRAVEEIVSSRAGAAPRSTAPRAGRHLPLLDDVASRLSDRLDTRVKVALGRNRGRLTVEFATVEDLDRILSVLDPGGPGVTGGTGPTPAPAPDDRWDDAAREDDATGSGQVPDVDPDVDPVVAVGRPTERYGY